jgi:hypothetical protein
MLICVIIAGIGLSLTGFILISISAFKTAFHWGVIALLVPAGAFIFSVTHWMKAGRYLCLYYSGIALMTSYYGFDTLHTLAKCEENPSVISIDDFGKKTVSGNIYVKITGCNKVNREHFYFQKNDDSIADGISAFYPLISKSNDYSIKMNALLNKYKSYDNIPDGEFPRLDEFNVLVEKNYLHEGEINNDYERDSSVTGLISSRHRNRFSYVRSYVTSNFPNVHYNELIIIEENKTPPSKTIALVIISICFSLVVFLGTMALLNYRKYRSSLMNNSH